MKLNSKLSKAAQRFVMAGAVLLMGAFAWAQPVPVGSLADGEGFLGSTVTLGASFSNPSPNSDGYGPYLDVVLPPAPTVVLPFDVKYLNQTIVPQFVEFGADGFADHPFALDENGDPLRVSGQVGGRLAIILLPFGSMTPDQPSIAIDISLGIGENAQPDVPIYLPITPGFRYGEDPLDNPDTDRPIRGATTEAALTPRLTQLQKRLVAPEGDTPVGAAFTYEYEIILEIAGGQTLTDAVITDTLPNALVIRGGSFSIAGPGTVPGSQVELTVASQGTKGGEVPTAFPSGADVGPFAESSFTITLPSPIETPPGGATQIVVRYDFYIPGLDANGNPAGAANSSNQDLNVAAFTAQWAGNLSAEPKAIGDDASAKVNIQNDANQHPNEANGTIRLQKWVGVQGDKHRFVRPGQAEFVEFILDFQVSDVSAFTNVLIEDSLPDGLDYVEDSMALRYWRQNAGPISVPLEPEVAPNAGGLDLSINVSSALSAAGQAYLLGACVGDELGAIDEACLAGAPEATRGEITYRARVLNSYREPAAGYVLQNDTLPNTASVSGEILNIETGVPTGQFDRDDGWAEVSVRSLSPSKEIAYIGHEPFMGTMPAVSNGDLVTFRLTVVLEALAFHNLVVSDYLPKPVFEVPTSGLSFVGDCPGTGPPAVNQICYTPDSTFSTTVDDQINIAPVDYEAHVSPGISVRAATNSFHLDFGSLAVTEGPAPAATIDLFVTLAVADTALADGLFITNLLEASDFNSRNLQSVGQEITQLQYTRPQLNITNGIIEVTGESALVDPRLPVTVVPPLRSGSAVGERNDSSYDLDVQGLDARDVVTVLVIVENTGRGKNGVYDLSLREQLPAGLHVTDVVPGSLRARRGIDGQDITLPNDAEIDLFGAGIELAGHVLERGRDAEGDLNTTGSNILYLTYDVKLHDLSESARSFTTRSHVDHYAAELDGENLTASGLIHDDVTVSIIAPALTKSVVATSEGHTTGTDVPQVAIGEVVRYRLAMSVPEGKTTSLVLSDLLPSGLSFLPSGDDGSGVRVMAVSEGAVSIGTDHLELRETGTDNAWLELPWQLSVPAVLTVGNSQAVPTGRVTVSENGYSVSVDLGDLVNLADNPNTEMIVVEFNALVRNTADNDGTAGVDDEERLKQNQYTASAGAEGDPVTWASNAAPVRVFEPRLSVTKTVDPESGIDAGDALTYTITVTNSETDAVTAFDVELVDALPEHVIYSSHSVESGGTVVPVDGGHVGGTITVSADSIAPGASIELTIQATLAGTVPSGVSLINTANLTASSLPNEKGSQANPTGGSTPGEPGTEAGERVYRERAEVSLFSRTLEPLKRVVATSETHTVDIDVAVGEVVRFRLATLIPEGVNNGLTFTDTLPPGLGFVDPEQVRFGFIGRVLVTEFQDAVSTDECSSLGTLTAPSNAFPVDRVDASDPNKITFDLGNVTNNTTDNSLSCVLIEYNALVDGDVAQVVSGASLENEAIVTANEVDSTTATSAVTVVEPALSVTKTVDVGDDAADAGDTVVYTIEIAHTTDSNADAFDLVFTDTLPVEIANPVATAPSSAVSTDIDDRELTITAAELKETETITVTITGTLIPNLQPGTQVVNTVTGSWTSLPGDGTAANETGSSSRNQREYEPIQSTATFTTRDLTLEKAVQATSEVLTEGTNVAIGEVVRYRLTVGLPEGVIPELVVTDMLQSGLAAVDGARVRAVLVGGEDVEFDAVSFTGAQRYESVGDVPAVLDVLDDTGNLPLPTSAVEFDGNQVTISLGDVTNPPTDGSNELAYLILEFNATVDVAGNTEGTVLTNQAQLTISDDVEPRRTAAADATVREPSLELTKTVLEGDSGWSSADTANKVLINADIGETVTFQLTLTNNGFAAAYDVNLLDALASVFELGDVRITSPDSGPGTVTPGDDLNVNLPVMQPGDELIVEYEVLITDSATFGQTIPNTASFSAYSVQDPNDNEDNRTGSEADRTKNYEGADIAQVVMAEPALALVKQLSAGPTVSDGGIYALTFTFEVENVGTIQLTDLQVTDDLSAAFSGSGITVTGANVTNVTIDNVTVDGVANGDFDETGSDTNLLTPGVLDLDPGKSAIITLAVQVQLSEASDLREYVNSAEATGSTPGGIDATPVDSQVEVTFEESATLELTKELFSAEPNQDGTFNVAYHLTITNDGTVPLAQLQVTDDLSEVFGAGGSVTNVTVTGEDAGSTVTPNSPAYDGLNDFRLLVADNSMLGVGASETLLLSFTVAPANSDVAYENRASAEGTSPLGQDAEANATAEVTFEVDPKITIGTCLPSEPESIEPRGTFELELTVKLRNDGDVQLSDAQATLDLSTVFAADSYTLVEVELVEGNAQLNAGYGNSTDWNLLASDTTLYTSNQADADADRHAYIEIVLSIIVVPGNQLGYDVNANASGSSPLYEPGGSGEVTDEATDWCDTEDPGDSPTRIVFSDKPALGVAKRFSGLTAVEGQSGVFDITFEFVLKNYGDAQLNDIALEDDFASVFEEDGGDWQITDITATAPLVAASPENVTADNSFNLLDSSESFLGSEGQENNVGTVRVTLRVAPNDPGRTFYNEALARGENPDGETSADDSVDGNDPDPDGDGDPTNNEEPTEFTFESPLIGIAKSVPAEFNFGDGAETNPRNLQDGTYQVAYLFTVVNYGDVELADLTVTDDLVTQLEDATPIGFEAQDGTLSAASDYDGQGGSNILADNLTLGVAATGTVYVIVNLEPGDALEDGSLQLSNQARVAATSPGGQEVSDASNDGTDPDVGQPDEDEPSNNGDGDPTNNAGPTITALEEAPAIALAKHLDGVENLGDGDYRVAFTLTVANVGNVNLSQLQVTDDLNDAFRNVPVTITELSATGPLSANLDLANALSSTDLLDAANSSLTVGQSATITLVVIITPGAELYEGEFVNTAHASGVSPAGTEVTDRSNDGTDPQPGGDDTTIPITEGPLIGVAKGVPAEFDFGNGAEANPRNLQDGTYQVAYLFTIGNYGDVVLTDLTLSDDLLTQLAAGNPVSFRAQDGSLNANAAWDGTDATNLLATGQSLAERNAAGPTLGDVYAVVTLQPGAELEDGSVELTNQAVASGVSPGQETVTDDSNEGFDPDVGQPDDDDPAHDDDGDPTNNSGETKVTLSEGPAIAVAKRLVSSENMGNGVYSVTYAFLLENQGDVNLTNVQLTDPFSTTFRGSSVSVTALRADAPLTAAATTSAQSSGTLLNAASSNLAVGESAAVEVTVQVVPGAQIHAGPFLNSATATGTSPSGAETSDVSNDGTRPNRSDHAPTPVTLTEEPILGVAKAANVTPVGDGRFDVEFTFTITNYGDVELHALQLTDDLDDAFGAGNYTVLSLYSPSLSVNAVAPDPSNPDAFDGSASQNLLVGTDTLAVGGSATAELLVRVRPAHMGAHENLAQATATSPGAVPVLDDSTDGLDPDPNGDGVPGENTPTPVPFAEAPLIGLAKNASVAVNDNGSFNVDLTFTVRNMGDVPLRNVQITDPLDGIYAITDLTPSHIVLQSSDLTVNPNYDGASDPQLLGGNNSLAVGAERQVTLRLQGVRPTSGTSTTNTALASGHSPNGTPTEDRSTDGFEPDPNGDGVPNEDTPTPIVFEVNPQIAIAKSSALSVNQDGSFEVSFTLTVANTGNTALLGVQVRDDLAEYYAGTDLTPARVSASSSNFTVNGAFDGQSDPRLLSGINSLPMGASGTITIVLERVTANTSATTFANTAVADGRSPDGTPTSDRSNDGLDPIPGVDVPTITDLIETPLVGVAKAARVVEELDRSFTVTFDFVLRNYGNVDLLSLSLTDDLAAFYADAGLNAGSVTISSSDLPVNAAFDGDSNTELLAAGANLAVGASGRVTVVLSGLSASKRTSYTNQADASGETPSGTPTPPERSTNGPDPDADGDGDPTNDNTPTPVELTPNPVLGVAKLARALQNDDGSYRVEFEIRLVNMGDAALVNLSLLDDLAEFYADAALSTAAVAVSSADLPVNPNFDGLNDLELLGANAALPVGSSGTVLVVLDPLNPVNRTRFNNLATGAGETPSGVPVEDDSHNGPNPDPDGDGDPGNNSEPTPVVLEPQPSVGVAKRATVAANDDGSFDVRFDFVINNYGNTRLENLQLRDDLTTFYELTDLTPGDLDLTSSDFTTNTGFDGQADPRLLAPGNGLGLGESGTLTLTLVGVRVSGPVDTVNSAVGTATDPTGKPARPDLSQDGNDPDPDGDGDPNNNSDPTPVKLGKLPLVGLAKSASVTQRDDGGYDITFTLLARNYGDVPLANLSITDSLADFYAETNLQPERVSVASDDLSVSAGYDGLSDLELLAPSNRLEVGASATLTIELSAVVPNSGVTRIDNSALVTGTAPDGTEVSDTSTDGSDPDPDGRGPSRHSEPTPVLFDSYVAVLLSKSVEPGPYGIGDRVPYTITIVNPNDVAVVFDLRDRLPEGTAYLPDTASLEAASLIPPEGSEPRQDEAGVIGWHSIVLPAGAELTVSYQLRVQPGAKGPLVNRAEVEGASSNGALVTATATASAVLDEGVFDLNKGLLIGRVYLDVNRDGNYQEGIDVPLKAARVVLSNGWQTLTDEQGNYAFRDLDVGTWTVMVDEVSVPYRAGDHPEQLRDERQHIVQVRGLTVSDFPFQVPDGLASSSRQTIVEFGPITLRKHLVQLPEAVRVVLEVTSDGVWPQITITDPVPGADPRTFVVTPGEPTTLTYDLPLGSPLTDPDINWSER